MHPELSKNRRFLQEKYAEIRLGPPRCTNETSPWRVVYQKIRRHTAVRMVYHTCGLHRLYCPLKDLRESAEPRLDCKDGPVSQNTYPSISFERTLTWVKKIGEFSGKVKKTVSDSKGHQIAIILQNFNC